jgi:hypothetical protein
MITDQEYKDLQKKVLDLEKKVTLLSIQLSTLILKNDVSPSQITKQKQITKKDTTKYIFDGQLYCKRRLAYVCVKKYITENNISCYEDILKVFPNYIQGPLGVIRPAQEAERYANSYRRFYFADDDVILFNGNPYVICSQWEKKNIDRILSIAEKLGYVVSPINI